MNRRAWLGTVTSLTLWCVLYMLASPQPVHAYVDPGSGLLLLQAAGSIIVSVAFMARSKIRAVVGRIARAFRRDGKAPIKNDPPSDDT